MQLSAANSPAETNLAALLLGGIALPSAGNAATPTSATPAGFAQLFPDLAPNAPTGDSTPTTTLTTATPAMTGAVPFTANFVTPPITLPAQVEPSPTKAGAPAPMREPLVGEEAAPLIGARVLTRGGQMRTKVSTGNLTEVRQEVAPRANDHPDQAEPAVIASATPRARPAPVSVRAGRASISAGEGRRVVQNDPPANPTELSPATSPSLAAPGATAAIQGAVSTEAVEENFPAEAVKSPVDTRSPSRAPALGGSAKPENFSPAIGFQPNPCEPESPTETPRGGARPILPALHDSSAVDVASGPHAPVSHAPSAATLSEISPNVSSAVAIPLRRETEVSANLPLPSERLEEKTPAPLVSSQSAVSSAPELVPNLASPQASDAAAAIAGALVESAEPRISRPVVREEKFAARGEKIGDEKISPRPLSQKTFLNAEEKRVTPRAPDLGIGVAKSAPAMSAPNFSNRPAPAAPSHLALAAPAAIESATRGAQVLASDAPVAAQRAVEAVLTAAERFTAGDRHSVNLHFSVGGADLAVRVELRADEIRATFRTDSAELRTALAHEWQSVTTDSAERPVRLAAPVFTSNTTDSAGLAAFTGDSASRQRDSGARRTAEEVFGSINSRARSAVQSAVSAADEIVSPATRLAALPTALHLHTLA